MDRIKKIKQRQNIIVGVVVAVAAILLVVVIGLSLSGNRPVDESIFKPGDSDNRLVISMGRDEASFEDSEYEPEITRFVYYHDGKNITSVEVYFEYETEDEAKEANEHISLEEKEWATRKRLSGRYIVFDAAPDQYEGLTAEQMRETIEGMKAAELYLDETPDEEIDVDEEDEEIIVEEEETDDGEEEEIVDEETTE